MSSLAPGLLLIVVSLTIPPARADLLFVGSQAGECCFEVDLHQVSSTDVKVTVTLTSGATYFVDTGSGQHPGFAFNLKGDPGVSISNLSSPWNSSDVHLGTVTTGGHGLGKFDYFIDNPGPGSSAHNSGPLSFDVTLASGISLADFIANSDGYYFVADIADASGDTGLSGISAKPISDAPEPMSACFLLGILGFGVMTSLRRKLARDRK